jgi:glycosyltransferase involved in cell wall biosynthesis
MARAGIPARRAEGRIRVLYVQAHGDMSTPAFIQSLIMRHLDPARVEVHVACPQANGTVPDALRAMQAVPGAHVRPTRFAPSMHRRAAADVARAVAAEGPAAAASLAALAAYARRCGIDVVQSTERPREVLYGWALGALTGARTVVHLNSTPADWMTGRAQWAMRRADAVVCVSRAVADEAVARGQPRERAHVVLNGLDLADWAGGAGGAGGAAVRAELGVPADALMLSIIARVVPSKGHGELLEALGRLRDDLPPFRLVVVGDDDASPGVMPEGFSQMAALRARSRRLGLEDRVIFAGTRADVRPILAATDIYAMPSRDEAFGMSFAEAMAMGCPVVAVDAGGVREVVLDGRTGLLSPPDDVAALAANIARLAGDPALRRAMGSAGRARVEGELNAARMAAQVELVYRALLSSDRATDGRRAA